MLSWFVCWVLVYIPILCSIRHLTKTGLQDIFKIAKPLLAYWVFRMHFVHALVLSCWAFGLCFKLPRMKKLYCFLTGSKKKHPAFVLCCTKSCCSTSADSAPSIYASFIPWAVQSAFFFLVEQPKTVLFVVFLTAVLFNKVIFINIGVISIRAAVQTAVHLLWCYNGNKQGSNIYFIEWEGEQATMQLRIIHFPVMLKHRAAILNSNINQPGLIQCWFCIICKFCLMIRKLWSWKYYILKWVQSYPDLGVNK